MMNEEEDYVHEVRGSPLSVANCHGPIGRDEPSGADYYEYYIVSLRMGPDLGRPIRAGAASPSGAGGAKARTDRRQSS
jgi:hypothetical protein